MMRKKDKRQTQGTQILSSNKKQTNEEVKMNHWGLSKYDARSRKRLCG